MRRISPETVVRLRELIVLLTNESASIEQIVEKTSIPKASNARKMIVKLKQDYGITVNSVMQRKKMPSSSTYFCIYSIDDSDKEKALTLTSEELGKCVSAKALPLKIKALADAGHDIDFICGKLDKTRSCIMYHVEKYNLKIKARRNKELSCAPPIASNDMLTIYMPRPKCLR